MWVLLYGDPRPVILWDILRDGILRTALHLCLDRVILLLRAWNSYRRMRTRLLWIGQGRNVRRFC